MQETRSKPALQQRFQETLKQPIPIELLDNPDNVRELLQLCEVMDRLMQFRQVTEDFIAGKVDEHSYNVVRTLASNSDVEKKATLPTRVRAPLPGYAIRLPTDKSETSTEKYKTAKYC